MGGGPSPILVSSPLLDGVVWDRSVLSVSFFLYFSLFSVFHLCLCFFAGLRSVLCLLSLLSRSLSLPRAPSPSLRERAGVRAGGRAGRRVQVCGRDLLMGG